MTDSGPVRDAIASATQRCLSSFLQLATTVSTDAAQSPFSLDLLDELEAYRVWVRNSGALGEDHAALDYRLRDNLPTRKLFLTILSGLTSNLGRCISTLEHKPIGETTTKARERDSNADDESTSDSTPGSGSDSDFGSGFGDISRDSILDACLKDISSSIDRLATVTRAIRRSSGQSRNAKAQAYEEWEDTPEGPINKSALFESFIGTVLEFHFRDTDERVRSRLRTAISRCHKQLAYRRKHQKKLMYGGSGTRAESGLGNPLLSVPQAVMENTKSSSSGDNPLATNQDHSNSALINTFKPRSPMSQTTASALRHDFRPTDTRSSVVSGSSSSRLSGRVEMDIPPPPPLKPGDRHFECPYCCILLPRTKAKVRLWNKHVIADIQPYVCVFNECSLQEPFFESKAEWRDHEISKHNIQYSCNGFGSHVPEIFFSRRKFEEHLTEFHPRTFSGSEISKLVDISAQPSPTVFDNCPFCDFSVNGKEQQTPSIDHTMQEWQMQNHVLDHLLSLFLMALPERDDLPEASSSKSRLVVSEHSVQSLDVTKLDAESEDYLDDDYLHVYFDVVPHEETQGDWGFLPLYNYGDPDTDRILNNFKLRLQANSALDPLFDVLPQNDLETAESKDITKLREAMDLIPDEFGFINATVRAWDGDMKTLRQQNELARQRRQHTEEKRIGYIFRKNELKRTEASRKIEEDRYEYQAFVETVFNQVWTRLNSEDDQLTPLYAEAVRLVEEALAGRDMFEPPGQVCLAPALESLIRAYQKLDIRYQKRFEAVLERNRRLTNMEVKTRYAQGNAEQVPKVKEDFETAEKQAILEFYQERDERANLLMDIMDQHTLRGVGTNQDYMESICQAVSKTAESLTLTTVPDDLVLTLETILLKAHSITSTLAQSSEQIVQIFHVADTLLNAADYEVSVAKAKISNALPTDFERLRQVKDREDSKLVKDLEHRLYLIRKDTRRTHGEIGRLLRRIGKESIRELLRKST